ncbi:MAG: PAS domain S-box protein, partial [Anaerolineaceae bacterium]|nr:PAS domain S-box protein [Anaerolineaceae bacterium]
MSKQVHFTQVFLDTLPCVALLIQKHTREIVAANKQSIEAGITPGEKCFEARYQRTEPCEKCLAPMLWETGKPQQLEIEESGVIQDFHWVPVDEDTYLNYAFDITEPRKSDEYLNESDERLNHFIASSSEAFYLLDSDLNLIMINQAGIALSPPGTNEKDVIGKNILDIAPNLEETGRYAQYLKIIETGEPLIFPDIVPHPKFGDIHFSVKAFKVGDGLGMTIEDITERVQTEQTLRESEEKYRSLFEQSPETIILVGLDGTILDHNHEHSLIGISREKLIGRNFSELGIFNKYSDMFARIADGQIESFEIDFETPTGNHIWLEIHPAIVHEAGDKCIRFMVNDITERKQAEEALRESEMRLQLALEGGRLGVWDENYVTGEAVFDEGWAEMLGYSLDEIEQTVDAWEKLVHPDDMSLTEKPFAAYKKGETPLIEVEFRMRAKSGEWRWIQSRGQIVERDEDGNPVRGTGTHHDITERKRTEAVLFAS